MSIRRIHSVCLANPGRSSSGVKGIGEGRAGYRRGARSGDQMEYRVWRRSSRLLFFYLAWRASVEGPATALGCQGWQASREGIQGQQRGVVIVQDQFFYMGGQEGAAY